MTTFTPGPWDYDAGDFSVYALETFEPIELTEANARLIAAAPALYEALKDMREGWRYIRERHGDLYGVGWDRAEHAADAALAAATGDA